MQDDPDWDMKAAAKKQKQILEIRRRLKAVGMKGNSLKPAATKIF